jgi:prepilin-type N-terminal cleavage/methylation domain-containing protein
MKHTASARKGFTLIELLVVITIIGVLASLGIASYGPIRTEVRKMKSKDNLRSLYVLLQLYAQNYRTFPTTQPPERRYEQSGGVRDLYPLYTTGIMKSEQLELLKAPGAALIPFSADPRIEEFDKNHIGYAYNSTAIPDAADSPPLISEQGVSSGSINEQTQDRGTKPIFDGGVNVLFTSGKITWIPADQRGKLSVSEISPEEWALLQD